MFPDPASGTRKSGWLLTAILVTCGGAVIEPAWAQEQPVLSAPVASIAPPAPGPSLDGSLPKRLPPGTPSLLVDADCFVNAEIALVFPHLDSLLTAPVRLG